MNPSTPTPAPKNFGGIPRAMVYWMLAAWLIGSILVITLKWVGVAFTLICVAGTIWEGHKEMKRRKCDR